MAIYSLHHQPIGKATQARPHTSAAHVRYITRPSAASHIEAGRMPLKPHQAAAFLIDAEDGDRKNARVSDKLMLALPRELDTPQRAALVRDFAEAVTVGRAPWLAAHHDKGKDALNPHCHLLIRDRDPATGKRVAGLSEMGSTNRLRALWEDHANRALERAGRPERIDRRTLEAQGIERAPTVHEGPKAQQMERRGARPESRSRRYRNRPGSRLPHRQVDYHGIDKGRSRPAYNRDVRETPADYWRAMDEDNQARELDQLRAIHHRPDLVISRGVGGAISKRIPDQHSVDAGIVFSGFTRTSSTEGSRSGILPLVPPARNVQEGAPQGVAMGAGHNKIFKPAQRTAEQPAKSVEQNINHKVSIRNKNLICKGGMMGVDDEERRRQEADLAAARAREEKSRAARDNALDKGYMRPDLAGPSIDRFYKNKGANALKERFNEATGPSTFGVKKGNPLTKEGRAKRADANEARRDIPTLWDSHAHDRKNRDAAERAFANKYGPKVEPNTPPPGGPQGPSGAPSGQTPQPRQTPQYQPRQEQHPSFSQSPGDAQNAQARREMMEKLAREQNPAYARSAGQPQASAQQTQQSPEDRREAQARENHPAHSGNIERAAQQPLQDRRNEAAARELQARENHPGHAKNTAQQPQRPSFSDNLRSSQPVPERKGSFSDRLAEMKSKPQASQEKTRSNRGRDDEIER